VVPFWRFEDLSVGYDNVKETVAVALADLQHNRAEPLFVRGEWGTGKSHLLSFIRASASSNGFVSARIDLNSRSAPLNHPQRFLPSLTDDLRSHDCRGLRALLYKALEDPEARRRIVAYARSGAAADLQWPLCSLIYAYESGERVELDNHYVWRLLQGADLSWSDHVSKREKALARLQAISLLCRTMGCKGLILLFDEAETIDQLWNIRSRMSAYSVARRLCRMLGIWCVFGITRRFERTVDADWVRLPNVENVQADAATFLGDWHAGRMRRVEPPPIDANSARSLVRAIIALYDSAYQGASLDERTIERCLTDWRRNPTRNPRLLVRLLIHSLDAHRQL
jgi:hypothetical protein